VITPGQRVGFGQRSAASMFSLKDVAAIEAGLGGIEAIAPSATSAATAVYGNQNWSTTLIGTDNRYFQVRDWTLESGRRFTAGEAAAGQAVCVIGATVRENLFGRQDPLGSNIRLREVACQVVGVLETKGQTGMGTDQDDLVVLPLRTFWRRFAGNRDVSMISLSAQAGISTSGLKVELQRLLRELRNVGANEDDDFSVLDMKEVAQMVTSTTRVLTMLLGAVAAVSLLVGGIGIMNIMLVSVTERTREIGIRLAVGALEREVLLQFLVEAVVLAVLGGLVGIALAVVASLLLTRLLEVPYVFDLGIVLIAFGFSATVGVVFGFVPARKAARLNPIDALRHE
jgi:putative ABC transport system permease protein